MRKMPQGCGSRKIMRIRTTASCQMPCVNMSLFHNVFKRDNKTSGNQRSPRDVICKIAQFKMADVKNFEANFQRKNWLM